MKIVISADVAQAIRALAQTEQGLGGVGQQAERTQKQTTTMGDVMRGTLAAAGIQAGISGMVGGLKSVVAGGLAYESSLNTMGAVTQASGAQMQQVADIAKQLGADITIPGASAQSAAAAMTELAKGGLTADQSMQAARGTMILAAAAQVDGAQAAEIQANALNTFGLKADQAGRVANVLANVANKSSGEITDFAQGLAQAGTVAAGFGWSIEETSNYLGLMANAGIKGSDAGTSLKTTMTALLNPTKAQSAALAELGIRTQDANGNMISARDLAGQLATAKGRMSDAEFNAAAATAFGTDAVRTALVAAQAGATGFDEMATALGNVDGAQNVAAANSKGLTGIVEGLKNTVDSASLSLFEALSPAISEVTTAATGLVTPLADALAPTLGSVANLATGTLSPALGGLTSMLGAVAGPVSAVVNWFSDLPGPVGTAVFALGGVIALRGPLVGTFSSASGWMTTLVATLRGTGAAAAAGSAGLAGWIASLRAASGAAATFGVIAKGALSVLGGPIGLAIVGVTTALSLFSSGSDEAADATQGLNDAIDEQTGKLKGNAAQIIATEAANNGASAAYERIGGNVSDYVDALGGIPEAQERVNAKLAESRAAYDAQQEAMLAASRGTGNYGSAMGSAAAATGAAVPSIFDLNSATEYLSSASGTLADKTDKVRLANEGATGALAGTDAAAQDASASLDTATQKATPFADALKDLRGAAAEADAASQFLNLTLIQMAGGQVAAEQATRANEAAFREIGNSARDYAEAQQKVADKEAELTELSNRLGTEYKGQTVTQADLDRASRELADAKSAVADADDRQFQAGTKAAESASAMASQAYLAKAAQGDFAGGIAEATRVMEEQRQKFIDNQTQINGGNIPAAEELANKYGLIPSNVTTTFQQKGADDALQRVKDLNAELDKVNNKTVRYYVVNGSSVQLDAPSTTGRGASTTDYLRAQAEGKADGGWVSGAGGPRDDMVPARLSPGEFVVNAASAGRNAGLLEAINAGALGFADGGLVPGVAASSAPAATAGAAVAVTAPDPAVFEAAWSAIATAAQDAWTATILPVMQAMSAQNAQAGVEFTALASTIQTQQQGVIAPTYDALNLGAQGVGAWQQWLSSVWAQSWQANQDRTAAGVAAISASEAALAAATDVAWSSIGARIQGTYAGQIVPAWAGVQDFMATTGQFFADVQAGVSSAADEITGDIADIQAALGEFFTVVDARTTPALADGGSVSAAVAGAFADGGLVRAGTTPRADDVLIRVSKGEFVVNAAATAQHRDELERINSGTAAFADGGLVGERVRQQMVSGSQQAVGDAVVKVLGALSSAVNVAGYNSSQDPSSFGWGRAANIVPFSWQGNPILGGVAAGTEGVWASLLGALVPQIPGGLTEGIYGFANRDNVNSPGRASFHAYGLAADINAGANPNGVPIDSRSGQGVIPAGPARQIAARLGMLWGGDFGGTPDSMHFEIHVPPSAIGALGTGVSQAIATGAGWKQGILDAIGKGKDAAAAPPASSPGSIAYAPTAGVEQWRDEVLFGLAFMGESPSLADTVLNQVRTESSGNPNAINLADSNAMRGTPSKGLVQVIDPTFRSYALPPYNVDIWDPISNLIAGMNYARSRYGSIAQGMRGVAYENGGVLPPGFTMAWNGTGQNEFTFTKDQLLDKAKSFDATGFAVALEKAVGKALQGIPSGVQIGQIIAHEQGAVLAEMDFAFSRSGR